MLHDTIAPDQPLPSAPEGSHHPTRPREAMMLAPETIRSISITARQMSSHVPPWADLDLASVGVTAALTGRYDPGRTCTLTTFQRHRAIWGMREAMRDYTRRWALWERHHRDVVPHPFPEHLRIIIRAVVSMLHDRDRDVIDRYYYRGMTLAEIAAQEGVTESAISLRMTAVLGRLRHQWQTITPLMTGPTT